MTFLKAPFLSFVLSVLLLSLFFGDELSNPNSYFMSEAGDGYKNYYTFAYHQQYDSSFSHFGGMAYPYGEQIVFTDGQPSLALFSWLFRGASDYSIALINLLLILGIGLSAWILTKLFIRFGMTRGGSLFAATAIALMSPQIMRFSAHYALAYCFVVPWFIYVAFLYVEKPSYKRGFWVFLCLIFITGLHLYYFLMAACFIGAYYLIEAFRRKNQSIWKYALAFGVQVILPFILYMLWMKSTDLVTDRPSIPYGMLEYMALWEGVFLPYYFYHDSAVFQALDVRKVNSEALAYVGWPATLYFVYFLLSRIKFLFQKRPKLSLYKGHAIFIAGFFVFLFAATLPFLMHTPFGEKYGGPLLQFRSLGRLSWVFYYALNIFMFVQLAGTRKRIGLILSSLATVILFLQGLHFNTEYCQELGKKRYTYAGVEELSSYSNHVLFPLPFFHLGSENLSTKHEDEYLAEPIMSMSLSSGIPTYACMMSRTSLSNTLNALEMAYNLSGPLMESEKAWMVVKAPSYSNRVSLLLPNKGNFMMDSLEAYSVKGAEWLKWKSLQRKPDSLLNQGVFYAGFENASGQGIAGSDGINFSRNEQVILYEGPGFADTVDLWYWLDAQYDGFRFFHLKIENLETGESWQHEAGSNFDNVMEGFARVHIGQQLLNFPCRISIFNNGPLDENFSVDEFLIQRSGTSFCYPLNGYQFTEEFVFKPVR